MYDIVTFCLVVSISGRLVYIKYKQSKNTVNVPLINTVNSSISSNIKRFNGKQCLPFAYVLMTINTRILFVWLIRLI